MIRPPQTEQGLVTRTSELAANVYTLSFESPGIARDCLPGQFVHLATGSGARVLRRPFSIARIRDRELTLIYRVVGEGTRWLRDRRPGDALDTLGPLGRPFALPTDAESVLLVGGGLGIAPLLALAEGLRASGCAAPMEALFGARSVGELFAADLGDAVAGLDWLHATDDGSEGFAGSVVDLLRDRLATARSDGASAGGVVVYAAGPAPMLRACAAVCVPQGIDLQVSMEAHMACGVGACRACAVVSGPDPEALPWRVCREGPVFDAAEIVWEKVGA